MTRVSAEARKGALGKDYGYSNARIRGMKSRLFTRDHIEQLVQLPDVPALIQALMQSEYEHDLESQLIHGRTSAQVDIALKDSMVRTFRKVLDILNDEAYELITTLLGRWDLFNIKTVVRGKHMQLTAGEIRESLLPAGQLDQVLLDALSASEDVRAVVDLVSTWEISYASALRRGYAEFMRSGDLPDLELELDRYYSKWAAERLARGGANAVLARRILGVQVATVNLVTAFRLLKADLQGVDPMHFFLEGGAFVNEDLFRELAAMSDIDEVLDRLRPTLYGKVLEEVAVAYLEATSVAVFERALEELLTRKAIAAGIGDPLGVGIAVSYLYAKQNEVTNLRIIVKGKAVGMPDERMRRELILV